jgi:hypothetical protein
VYRSFAVRAFTVQREQEISEVEEEITWLSEKLLRISIPDAASRILAVEQARLAELRRGMKEGSE